MIINILATRTTSSYFTTTAWIRSISMRRANAGRNVVVVAQDKQQKHIWLASEIKLESSPYRIHDQHLISALENADSNAQDIFIHTEAMPTGGSHELASLIHLSLAHVEAAALDGTTRTCFMDILTQLVNDRNPDSILLAIDTTAANDGQIQDFQSIGDALHIQTLLMPDARQHENSAILLYRMIFKMRHLC